MNIEVLTFNPFSENTYIISSDSGDCTIIDPGCYDEGERTLMEQYLSERNLKPKSMVLTHAHLDHVFGCQFIKNTYNVPFHAHKLSIKMLESCPSVASIYGMNCDTPPEIDHILEANTHLEMGGVDWQIFYTPGHSVDSISFYHAASNNLIVGDVLFQESIGRTDLPGGDMDVIVESIQDVLYKLPDETIVWPGHGPRTTIGHEKLHNPFVKA